MTRRIGPPLLRAKRTLSPEAQRERDQQRELRLRVQDAELRREREAEQLAAREAARDLELADLTEEEHQNRGRQAREMLSRLDELQAGGYL